MTTCTQCEFFNIIPKEADDYEPSKGDCVTEKVDEKGAYWLSKPVSETADACASFHKR